MSSEVSMDSQLAKLYRNRWQAAAEIEAAEQRASSIEERWRQTNQLLGMALALGLDLTRRDDEHEMRSRLPQRGFAARRRISAWTTTGRAEAGSAITSSGSDRSA